MLNSRVFHLLRKQLNIRVVQLFHHEFTQSEPPELGKDEKKAPLKNTAHDEQTASSTRHKFKVFQDEDSTEILDVEEMRQSYLEQDAPNKAIVDEFLNLNLERGVHGVYDIEDLVDVLHKENAQEVFVCSVPKELKYVDYLVVCSGRSYRHMIAIATFVRRMYKMKRQKGDILPKIEGEKSRHWMALDLGNIALHIFSEESREVYDLESLWSIGSKYDKESNKPHSSSDELFTLDTKLLSDLRRT